MPASHKPDSQSYVLLHDELAERCVLFESIGSIFVLLGERECGDRPQGRSPATRPADPPSPEVWCHLESEADSQRSDTLRPPSLPTSASKDVSMRCASHCTKADATDKAQLLTVPPNAFAFFAIIANSWHSDRTHERPKVSSRTRHLPEPVRSSAPRDPGRPAPPAPPPSRTDSSTSSAASSSSRSGTSS